MAINPPARNDGKVNIQYLRKEITFASPAAVVVGTLPLGASILKPISGVQVDTAFNAATTNTLHIGESTPTNNDDLYGTSLSLATVTFVPIDEAVPLKVTADTVITCTYNQTGTAATAGVGTVVIAYTMPDRPAP